jgi:hypothetical protein
MVFDFNLEFDELKGIIDSVIFPIVNFCFKYLLEWDVYE